jgi:hypothetical protein
MPYRVTAIYGNKKIGHTYKTKALAQKIIRRSRANNKRISSNKIYSHIPKFRNIRIKKI